MPLLSLFLIATAAGFGLWLIWQPPAVFPARAYVRALRGIVVLLILSLGLSAIPPTARVVALFLFLLAKRVIGDGGMFRGKFLLLAGSTVLLAFGVPGAMKANGWPAGMPLEFEGWFLTFVYVGGLVASAAFIPVWQMESRPETATGPEMARALRAAGGMILVRLLLLIAAMRSLPAQSPDWGKPFVERLFPLDQVGAWFSFRVFGGFFIGGALWFLAYSAWKARRPKTLHIMVWLLFGVTFLAELSAAFLRL